jgi:hypothetical protein
VRLAFRRAEPPWTLYADCPPPVLHILSNNDHPGVYYNRHDHGPRRIRHHWHSQAEAASKEALKLQTSIAPSQKIFFLIRQTCQHFRKISSAPQLAFWRIQQDHRVLPVSTHSASRKLACMHASSDPRLPKAKANALPSTHLMHALCQHHAPSRLRRTHSLLSPQLSTTSLRLLSRLCIISRQAFLATSFTLLSRSTAARCSSFQHPALHLPPMQSLATQTLLFRHRRLGFLKRKMAVATPGVLG